MNLGGTHSRGSSLPGQNATINSQIDELNKRLRQVNKTLCCLTIPIAGTDPGGGGGSTPFSFRYGLTEFPTTVEEIEAGSLGTGIHGQKTTVLYSNPSDDFLWYAEPSSEPLKTRWYNTGLNQAPIGTDELFDFPTTIGSWRLYVTSYATSFTGPVEFRLS